MGGQRLHDRGPVAPVAGAPVGHDDGYAALTGHAICYVFAINQDRAVLKLDRVGVRR